MTWYLRELYVEKQTFSSYRQTDIPSGYNFCILQIAPLEYEFFFRKYGWEEIAFRDVRLSNRFQTLRMQKF